MTRAALVALLVALGGCHCSGAAAPPLPTPPAPPPTPPAVFDVHEWGLLDVTTAGARLVGGPPGGPTNWNAPRRKPVLYFHLADGTTAVDANVTVSVAPGTIVERFPLGELSSDARTLTWSRLALRGDSCHVTGIPTVDSPACRTLDDLCEATELATYETADAACVVQDGVSFNHLFYRANGPPPPLPFDVAIQAQQVSIRHARATDLVGPILYVHNADGEVTIATITPPALGASVIVSAHSDTDVPAAQHTLDAAMTQTGLTPNETAAFDRAWATDLFGRTAARDMPARRMSPGPADYLLFVLPASLIDGASRIVVTPSPRMTKRFLLVRFGV